MRRRKQKSVGINGKACQLNYTRYENYLKKLNFEGCLKSFSINHFLDPNKKSDSNNQTPSVYQNIPQIKAKHTKDINKDLKLPQHKFNFKKDSKEKSEDLILNSKSCGRNLNERGTIKEIPLIREKLMDLRPSSPKFYYVNKTVKKVDAAVQN